MKYVMIRGLLASGGLNLDLQLFSLFGMSMRYVYYYSNGIFTSDILSCNVCAMYAAYVIYGHAFDLLLWVRHKWQCALGSIAISPFISQSKQMSGKHSLFCVSLMS